MLTDAIGASQKQDRWDQKKRGTALLPPVWPKRRGNPTNGQGEAAQEAYHNPPDLLFQRAHTGLLNAKLAGSQVSFPVLTDDAANQVPQPEGRQPGSEVAAKEAFHRFLGGFAAKPVHMGDLKQSKLGNIKQCCRETDRFGVSLEKSFPIFTTCRRHDSPSFAAKLFCTVVLFIGNPGKNVNPREDGPTQCRVGFGPLGKVQRYNTCGNFGKTRGCLREEMV